MLCRRVDKIPISNAFNDLAEMGFVDYGDDADFLRFRCTFRDIR